MNHQAQQHANEAIFQLQLNTCQAVQYVVRNSRITKSQAELVIKSTVEFHK